MITDRKLKTLEKKILAAMDIRGATLDIFLLPHGEIKALKAKFIKKKTEPNVLSFVEPTGFPHPEKRRSAKGKSQRANRHLGEIYLNSDILEKNPERTAPLLLHGILHLLGYDHVKKKDASKMEALEQKILRKISQSLFKI
jgi:probable rRNA maturation factor